MGSACPDGIMLVHGNQLILERNQLSNGSAIYAQGFGDRIENNDINKYRIRVQVLRRE
jgi:hypothetical protein